MPRSKLPRLTLHKLYFPAVAEVPWNAATKYVFLDWKVYPSCCNTWLLICAAFSIEVLHLAFRKSLLTAYILAVECLEHLFSSCFELFVVWWTACGEMFVTSSNLSVASFSVERCG